MTTVQRFSSQMLGYLGAQRTTINTNGTVTNAIKYHVDDWPIYPPATSVTRTTGEWGNYSPDVYNFTRCYFLSRGAGDAYSDTMSALAMDTSALMGISITKFLALVDQGGHLQLPPSAQHAMNMLRSPGNQLSTVKPANNRTSFQARQIRA